MKDDPMSRFSPLIKACIDEEESPRLATIIFSTALSVALGLVASGFTAYLLSFLPR